MKYILIAITWVLSGSVLASGACKELPPADDFACNAQVTFTVCKMQVELGLLKGSPPNEAFSCIEKNKEEIKPVYNSAKQALIDDEDATEALKDLYSYWLSSIDAIIPGADERRLEYRQKLSERELGMKDRANRLKIESE